MRRYVLLFLVLFAIVVCVSGCSNNVNEADGKDSQFETNNGELDHNSNDTIEKTNNNDISNTLHNAIEKTISENRFMVTISENCKIQSTSENNISNDGTLMYIDTISSVNRDISYINFNMDDEEIYSYKNAKTEHIMYSVNSGEVLKTETLVEKDILYVKNGVLYRTTTYSNGTTKNYQKLYEDQTALYLALIENYNNDYIKEIDFSNVVVQETENKTIFDLKINKDIYNKITYGKSIMSSTEYEDMTAQFTIEDGRLVSFKVDALVDSNTMEGTKIPWSIEYKFHNFNGDITITPPEGYEDFEEMS